MSAASGDKSEDQAAVLAFLARPETHGTHDEIVRIDTHSAVVFLAGEEVYKVKRAIRTRFLDYSTLEKRHAACAREVEINRVAAPQIYLGVVPISRDGSRLALGGDGTLVEWAVHMRRFDEGATFDRIAERGELTADHLRDLAAAVLASHRRAPILRAPAALAAFERQARDTVLELAEHADLLPPALARSFRDRIVGELDRCRGLLARRLAAGAVRRCHGDLHLRNIALVDGCPILFDAIEFSEAIATCDVLYDLAFLLMDLWKRGLRVEANTILNRYLWNCEDDSSEIEGLAALPLFLALRAAIRAKVAAELARLPGGGPAARAEAGDYLAIGASFLDACRPSLVGVGGLSGSGKSTVAARLAPAIGRAPGAFVVRSDIVRKRRLGVGEGERLPASAYTPEESRQTYARLRELAAVALRAGRSVIVDAVHREGDEREALAALAAAEGVAFVGLWLEAPVDLLKDRVARRQGDASDATEAVVERQAATAVEGLTWHRIATADGIEAVAARALVRCVREGLDGRLPDVSQCSWE